MKIQFKRIVSAVCALALCASMMPASALADDTTLSPSASPEISQQASDDSSSQEEETVSAGEEQEQPSADSVELYSNDLSAATYGWGDHDDDDENYVWNVATIEKSGSHIDLSEAQGDANKAEHVTVETSNDQRDWQTLTAGDSRTGETSSDRYIKVTAEPGYYIQTIVVACNDNGHSSNGDGFNCQTAYRGASYFASYDVNENSVILDTTKEDDEGNAFYHRGMGSPYHVLIQVAQSPNPVCIVYDAGEADGSSVAEVIEQSIVSADGGVLSDNNVAFWYAYDQEEGQTHEVLEPSVSTVTVGTKVYEFTGWELEYYQGSNTTDTDQFPTLSGQIDGYGTTVQSGSTVTLSTYAKLTAQWKKVDFYTGNPISIEVYVDGEKISLNEATPISHCKVSWR